MSYCVILSTASSQEEAGKIAGTLLESRTVSCVQMVPITSHYRWQGKIECAAETLMIIKTTDALYPKAEKLIKENHSYEVPQIVKLPITAGLPDYLNWISKETKNN